MAENYVKDYATAMKSNSLYNNLFNPQIINEVLKNLNMSPSGKSRAELLKMVHDPRKFEKPLRYFSQYLYNVQMPYKRLIHYYGSMLSFDLSLYPVNATDKDMKTDKFKRDYDRAWEFFDKFDYRKEFQQICLGLVLEDAKFMYLRNETDKYTLQEMPTDYCLIDSRFEYGWMYSFDLQYFHRQGVDINTFAPEFKDYYESYRQLVSQQRYDPSIRAEYRDGRWCYWQQINPQNSWVFKFHSMYAALIPPLLGLFVDANEIDNFKNLQSEKSSLDLFKLLIGTIPTNKSKDSSMTDDLAISAEMAGQFNRLINDMLPDQIKFGTVPFDDVKAFEFNSENKDNIVGEAIANFYSSSGSDTALFNSNKPNATTLTMSSKNDVSFVDHVYNEFQSFLNYQLSFITKKFKFACRLEGSIYDREERSKRQINLAQYGLITPQLPASLGLTEKEFRDGLTLMKSFGYENLLTPLQSANNASAGMGETGRPTESIENLKDSGVKTKDAGSNLDKKNTK